MLAQEMKKGGKEGRKVKELKGCKVEVWQSDRVKELKG
jgi:hypothetical protein